MPRYIVKKKLLISFLLLACSLYGSDIKVCLWRGDKPERFVEQFRDKYPKGEIYTRWYCGQFLIINRVEIEDYLMGVLAREMDKLWPLEALKAQAVVSRTLVMYLSELNKTKGLPYDIENSIFHQVYGTTDSEKIEKAISSTVGEVLSYKGKIVQVFFHACCGGKTALSSEVWGGTYPHISSVIDPYCEGSPYSTWEKVFTGTEISKALGLSTIERIVVDKTDSLSRVTNLKIFLKDGSIREFTGHRFRMEINKGKSIVRFDSPDIIPSTNFTIKKVGDNFSFRGVGYGHGVGMCQWGARKMAEQGFNYRDILYHYFPEMEIDKR